MNENRISKSTGVDTSQGKLILDSHKLSYHYERVKAWENNETIAPVSVDMALTRACGAMCSFCYAMVQEPQERSTIKTKEALDLLDDFAEIGVKGVSLISDGESTLSKAYVPFIQHASKIGIDVGNATNGWEWEAEKIEQVLPHLTWVRFTVAAGTSLPMTQDFWMWLIGDSVKWGLQMYEQDCMSLALKASTLFAHCRSRRTLNDRS